MSRFSAYLFFYSIFPSNSIAKMGKERAINSKGGANNWIALKVKQHFPHTRLNRLLLSNFREDNTYKEAMELQLRMPSPAVDLDFHSGRSSPHLSTPSTSRAFVTQFYFSAPTSPTRTTEFDHEFEDFSILNTNPIITTSCSASPSRWEERTTPHKLPSGASEADDFAFDIRKGLEKSRQRKLVELSNYSPSSIEIVRFFGQMC
ncbi:hypothetical protein Ancab_030124 [Ancistrocladus abbreviatus]